MVLVGNANKRIDSGKDSGNIVMELNELQHLKLDCI